MKEHRLRIAVLGGRESSPEMLRMAEETGRLIASKGAILICGGMSGIMEAACKGALEAGGLTVGILPTDYPEEGNPYITIPIVTGMGSARNAIILKSCHGAIAINGKYGTLSEIGYALALQKPLVGINTWPIENLEQFNSPRKAVEKLFALINERGKP